MKTIFTSFVIDEDDSYTIFSRGTTGEANRYRTGQVVETRIPWNRADATKFDEDH